MSKMKTCKVRFKNTKPKLSKHRMVHGVFTPKFSAAGRTSCARQWSCGPVLHSSPPNTDSRPGARARALQPFQQWTVEAEVITTTISCKRIGMGQGMALQSGYFHEALRTWQSCNSFLSGEQLIYPIFVRSALQIENHRDQVCYAFWARVWLVLGWG